MHSKPTATSCFVTLASYCSPDDRQGEFLGKWLNSHLEAVKSIGKPLLFEEFGKRLKDFNNAADIANKRDPVFAASYSAIEKAVESNQPLLGSCYWSWAFPLYGKGERVAFDPAVKLQPIHVVQPLRHHESSPLCCLPLSRIKQ